MEQYGASCSASSSFFIFVRPATVVSQCLTAEEIWFLGCCRWIIYQHHQDFVFVVAGITLVIIPPLLGSVDAIPYEDQVGVDIHILCLRAGKGDEVVCKFESLFIVST